MSPTERLAKREELLSTFNACENGLGHDGIFGLPFSAEESEVVLLPVPWEVTVSYGEGTAKGPEAILKASSQLDLHDDLFPGGWREGIAMLPKNLEWEEVNTALRPHSYMYLQEYASKGEVSGGSKHTLSIINKKCNDLVDWVQNETSALLDKGKIVGVIGGEHSVPLGYFKALAQRHEEFGILQVDAHADLRDAYEGFTYSHASIMHNALQIPQISKLVQVGIRDQSGDEHQAIVDSNGRALQYTDSWLKRSTFSGRTWRDTCLEIVNQLPQDVYLSFDIDGLNPGLCPNTGTPVPGGLGFDEAIYLLEHVVESGRNIIGFDLCEVAPGADEWDGNVGARVLYKLCLLALKSRR